MTARRFEVVSKIFGSGIFTLGFEMTWEFLGERDSQGLIHSRIYGAWRILSVGNPAKWHKDQAEEVLAAAGFDDQDDPEDSEPGVTASPQSAKQDANTSFESPPGSWLTIVTDIGEVLGFEIVKELP